MRHSGPNTVPEEYRLRGPLKIAVLFKFLGVLLWVGGILGLTLGRFSKHSRRYGQQ